MNSEPRFRFSLPVAIAFTGAIAGCVTQSPVPPEDRAVARPDPRPEPAAVQPARDAAPGSDVASVSEEQAEGDLIVEILAERRRSDYPEIELVDSGFTITEQVRIGSAARNDYERALIYLRQDRYEEGIALLRSAIEATPEATVPYIDLGIAYRLSGDLPSAEEALDTAALLSPENPVVHNELGILYRKTGRFAESRASYEKALAVYGDFHFARRNLAVLCDLYLGDLQCAIDNYRVYLDAVGSDPEVEIWLADLEIRLNQGA